MTTRVPAADALIVGLAQHLGEVRRRGLVYVGSAPDGPVAHAWTFWAQCFDHDDFVSLAEDIFDFLAEARVLELLTRFVTEQHAARLAAAVRRMGGPS